jgi:glycosyltransferase involved in cell wall biosynthesis
VRLSVVIPSYRRGRIAVESVKALLAGPVPPFEVILVDQTEQHPFEVRSELERLQRESLLRWIVLDEPSIPAAMNVGLHSARGDAVLFLDDDILPRAGLVAAHAAAQAQPGLVAGQVLQPLESPVHLEQAEPFRFNSDSPQRISEFMGGNFSVNREQAMQLGGFDENFVGAAYRFEAEFADRWVRSFGPIRFEPSASIRHLAIASGGTRAHGNHLRTASPAHAAGAYYFLLRTRRERWIAQMLWRPIRAIRTRHHLRRPWWIPVTLLAEARGLLLAWKLSRRGARLPFVRKR